MIFFPLYIRNVSRGVMRLQRHENISKNFIKCGIKNRRKRESLKSSVVVDDNVKASKKEREIKGKDVDKERKLELSPQPLPWFCVYVRVSLVKCEVSHPLYNIWHWGRTSNTHILRWHGLTFCRFIFVLWKIRLLY